MRTFKNLFTAAVLSAVALLGAAGTARALTGDMASISDLTADHYSEKTGTMNQVGLHVWYVGPSSYCKLQVGAASITAYAPFGLVDTSFNVTISSYEFSQAAYDTMGELCDSIDATANYECELVGFTKGGDRLDQPLMMQDNNDPTIPDNTATGESNWYDLKYVTGTQINIATNSFISFGIVPVDGKHVRLKEVVIKSTWGVTGASVTVYGVPAKYATSYSASHKRFGWANGMVRNTSNEAFNIPVSSAGYNGRMNTAEPVSVATSTTNSAIQQVQQPLMNPTPEDVVVWTGDYDFAEETNDGNETGSVVVRLKTDGAQNNMRNYIRVVWEERD